MGHADHGAGELVQELLQPFHAFGVQVVGGFVKQQHVGLGQQQAAQGHAALFTTGQVADDGVPGRQAQRVGGDFHLVFDVVRAAGGGRGDDGFQVSLLSGQGVEIGVRLGVGGVDLVQALLGGDDGAQAFFNRLAHRVLGVQLRFLRQVADVQARHGDGFAFDLFIDASHDLQQRRLARAVQAQHADLGARKKRKRDITQNLPLGRHDLADAVHGVDVLGHGLV
ncbi:hypothetical protein D3C72_983420 [compost metagenome]